MDKDSKGVPICGRLLVVSVLGVVGPVSVYCACVE